MGISKHLLRFLAFVIIIASFNACGITGLTQSSGTDKLWEWVAYPQYADAILFDNSFAAVSYGEPAILPNGELADFPLYGLVDENGELVVPIDYHWIGMQDGIFKVSKTVFREDGDIVGNNIGWLADGTPIISKSWIVNADGSLTLDSPNENRFDWYWETFVPNSYFDNNERNIKDKTTNEVLIPKYDQITPFSEGYAVVQKGTVCGLIDSKNNIVIPLEYDSIASFTDSQCLSTDQTPEWERISKNSVTRSISKDGKWGLINRKGEFVVNLIYDYDLDEEYGHAIGVANFYNGLAPVRQNGKCGAIDTMGKIVAPIEYQACSTLSGLASVISDNGLYGAYDSSGKLVVPYEYEAILGFYSDMIAVVKDEKVGFVNMDGDLAIENIFDSTNGFRGDFASVSRNGKWGFINKSGEVVMPIVFDYVRDFTEVIATVQVNGKWGFARPVSDDIESNSVLEKEEMDDVMFVNLQIDNPIANSNAILTPIDVDDDKVVPIIDNGRTLVPIRFVSENFNCDVEWDDIGKRVTIVKGDTVIELYIGENQAYVNGEAVEIDVAPVIRNGRTLIPARFIGENMGYSVDWRGTDRVVEIEQESD